MAGLGKRRQGRQHQRAGKDGGGPAAANDWNGHSTTFRYADRLQSAGARALHSSDPAELRNELFRAVGRAVYTSQMLESQLALILAILKDELALQVDLHSLAAPDHKRSLGQLIGTLSEALPEPFEGRETLSEALEARNRVVHHFFVRNNDAFTEMSVYRDALTALQSDSRKLSDAAILMHDVYLKLCKARSIDDARVVIRQFRVAGGAVQ